jgi:hypothetical protein
MRFFLSIAVLLATAAGVAVAATAHPAAAHPGRLVLIASVKHGVVLKGVPVTGLYPGASKPLSIKVKNMSGRTIKVPSLKGKLSAKTSRAGCTGARTNLILSWSGKAATIPNRKTRTMALTVTMPATVADACQGATFTITVSVRATKG